MPDAEFQIIEIVVEPAPDIDVVFAPEGIQGPPGPSSSNYEATFTQSNLSVAGLLPVTHGLNTFLSGITLWNQLGEQVAPDRIDYVSANSLAIDLSSFTPLQGIWTVSVTS